ncbi:MAG: hypothetical protein GX328_07770 [Clostridiaceae bacterium]|nr:hypothetical protein [Clostridiaceae bacterium]
MARSDFIPIKNNTSSNVKRSENRIFKNRNILIGLFFILMFLIIFWRTSELQLSSADLNRIPETYGNRAQMRVEAPRGDILDGSGEPIAYSITQPMLYLCNSGLKGTALNDMLLDLSELMLENGVKLPDNLINYFDYSSASKEKRDKSNAEFVFKKDLQEIEKWQQNTDLFGLKKAEETKKPAERIITDPQDFYEYLLFDKFGIEDRDAGGDYRYTVEEAFNIIQMRYLILEHNWQYTQGQAIEVGGPVNQKIITAIEEQNQRYAGVLIADKPQRQYSENSFLFSHVLGYTGQISETEYQQLKNLDYGLNDIVGKSGVELSAERYLHGIPGTVPYSYWQKTEDGEEFVKGTGGVTPQPGANVRLTIDPDVQKVMIEAFVEHMAELRDREESVPAKAASGVLMNVKTGAVIAMSSIPSFNPQDFVLAQYDAEAAERVQEYFQDNENKPMLNRAISEIYHPASTFKPFTAIAALENGVISETNQVYNCAGKEEIGHRIWTCYGEPDRGHGDLNLRQAMSTSCNLYFAKLGIDTTIDKLSAIFKKLGMGEYSEIDLPGEAKGIRPSKEVKRMTRALPEDQLWFPADTAQSSIGQFDNAYTMIQLARGVGGIATGKLVQPHVIKEITGSNGEIIKPEVIQVEDLGFSQTSIDLVKNAMNGLQHDIEYTETHMNFHNYPFELGMKTGTAEVQDSASQNISIDALFVCFAPLDDPEVVFAGIVEDATLGDGLSTVARKVLDQYFGIESPEPIPQSPPIVDSEDTTEVDSVSEIEP